MTYPSLGALVDRCQRLPALLASPLTSPISLETREPPEIYEDTSGYDRAMQEEGEDDDDEDYDENEVVGQYDADTLMALLDHGCVR